MTVVFVSEHTANSKWVNWEIKRSLDLGKEVVAFHTGDAPPKRLPLAVRENGIKVVPWSELKRKIKSD